MTGTRDLVLALLSVDGATAACATHGDERTVETLTVYYAIVAKVIARAEGTVIKVTGDGMLLSFPIERAREAVETLRVAQARASEHWRALDSRCSARVRATAGRVVSAPLGPPGAERADVYGDVLNQLYKQPPGDFVITQQLTELLA